MVTATAATDTGLAPSAEAAGTQVELHVGEAACVDDDSASGADPATAAAQEMNGAESNATAASTAPPSERDDTDGVANGSETKARAPLKRAVEPSEQESDLAPVSILKDMTTSVAMQAELQCTLCHEVLCKPVTSPCGHSFCRICLLDFLLSRGVDDTQCPICRGLVGHVGTSADSASAPVFSVNVTLWNVIQLILPALRERQGVEEDDEYRHKYDQYDAKWRIAALQHSAHRAPRQRSGLGWDDGAGLGWDDGTGSNSDDDGEDDGEEATALRRLRERYPFHREDHAVEGHLEIVRQVVMDHDDVNEDGYSQMQIGFAVIEFPQLFQLYNEHQECSLALIKMEEDESRGHYGFDDGMPHFMNDDGSDDDFIIPDYYNDVTLRVLDANDNVVMERRRSAMQGIVTFPQLRLDAPAGLYKFRFTEELYGLSCEIVTTLREPNEEDDRLLEEQEEQTARRRSRSLIHDQAGRSRRGRRNGQEDDDDDEGEDDDEDADSDDSFIVNDDEMEDNEGHAHSSDSGEDEMKVDEDEDEEEAMERRERQRQRRRQRQQLFASDESHDDEDDDGNDEQDGMDALFGPDAPSESNVAGSESEDHAPVRRKLGKKRRVVDDDDDDATSDHSGGDNGNDNADADGPGEDGHATLQDPAVATISASTAGEKAADSKESAQRTGKKRGRAIVESEDDEDDDHETAHHASSAKRLRQVTSRIFHDEQEEDDEQEDGAHGDDERQDEPDGVSRWIGSDPYWARNAKHPGGGWEQDEEEEEEDEEEEEEEPPSDKEEASSVSLGPGTRTSWYPKSDFDDEVDDDEDEDEQDVSGDEIGTFDNEDDINSEELGNFSDC